MTEYSINNSDMMRGIGAECTVLLKSDGAFPLEGPCALALCGSGARRTVKGGTGSGEVNSRSYTTVEAGLEAAGFTIADKRWMDGCDGVRAKARKCFIRELKRSALRQGTLAVVSGMGAVMPEPEYELPLDLSAEAAVYVLSRISGEGSDRRPVPGDILLTKSEIRDILELDRSYEKFLLVLNVGGPVDLSPVMGVRNILLLSQLGGETGGILADIMLGRSAPSGKLATTWFAWEDRPSAGDFGDRYDTHYYEGVYVGYRWFDSVGRAPLFPFGFGLSYTDFAVSAGETSEKDGAVTVSAAVKNTGRRPGREVVQLYVSCPQGRLGKPYQTLAAFAKTRELAPGETQELNLSFDLRDVASFDSDRSSFVLEAGSYLLRLGNSSRSTRPIAAIRLNETAEVRTVKKCFGDPGFSDRKPALEDEAVPAGLPVVSVSASELDPRAAGAAQDEIDPELESLSDEELCLMNIGAFGRIGSKSIVGAAGRTVAGAAGETALCTQKDIPALIMADGPAGLRLSLEYTRDGNGVHPVGSSMPESVLELMPAPAALAMKLFGGNKKPKGRVFEQNCTAIPIGTAIAQSWNTDLAEACGDIVGSEMERFGVHLWLAPALNIHRDVRCGRNFEYFSEDPLVSGRFAAALTRGVQRHPHCGVTLKHFAANNQETNRYGSNSLVSERALREIYLKGFETAVRESRPLAVMTSYNLINGVHTSEHRGLIEGVLRGEFGFGGIVMTDWIIPALNSGRNRYPAPNAARIAAEGGDLVMPGGPADLKAMLKGLKRRTLTRRQLLINASRTARMARRLAGREK